MSVSPQKVGSVLVVGGGIAGMQAALDCANSGFKVYLLEQQASIGGNMVRLDKTFPTNDCAMCMISPKLVETGRHLNIEIISYTDLQRIEGHAGDFTATIRKRARYIDEQKCNGCGDCERECPVQISDTFNGELIQRKAIYRLYPQAIPNVFTIDKHASPPPCRGTCPAGVNAQGYVALTGKGKFLQALDVVRERMPFAGVCGRICHHPCEGACNRSKVDEAVSVRNIKRFLSDYERERIARGESIERPPSEAATTEKRPYTEKVAVIGGGPAGLTCAGDLARRGYPVTVFDANAQLGGMLRTGIPAYRLPRETLDHEINEILALGVAAETGKALGRDFTLDGLKAQGFQAVFVATGAQLAKRIALEGSEAKGVLYGIDFLRDVNTGQPVELGQNIVVIGGGNVAMDVARAALRAAPGSQVSLYCLESRIEMPAHIWEITEAQEEGVAINPSWGPSRVIGREGQAEAFELVKCVSVFDENRRFNPKFDPQQKQTVAADTIILAIGQGSDDSFIKDAVKTRRGFIEADRLTLATSAEGIFAGGDNVLGPASLVQAVEQGHRGAKSIHRHLRGLDPREDREPVERPAEFADVPQWADLAPLARQPMRTASLEERRATFAEIDLGYSEAEAVAEASRCLQCGGCSVCKECVRVCKAHAVEHGMTAAERELKVGAVITTNGYDVFDARRKPEYGFGRYPNVVTSMQFERILSASGPYQGHLQRPGDGKTPRKIAWIQCVGSRDRTQGNDYCSSVCCMVATKAAIIAKEHEAGVESTIFYIDMRAFGKGHEGYYNRAKDQYGVRYVRSQISSIKEEAESGNLILRAISEEGRRPVDEVFDLVVLSVGLVRHHAMAGLADTLGIECNKFGFAQSQPFEALKSSREGVFLCGAVSGPKDIPETVMESSAAAALVGELLHSVRGTQVKIKEYPVERDVEGEAPRIGVFVCHCGTNIASVIDVGAVAEYIQRLPGVAYAEHTLYTCSQDTQERIKQIVRDQGLNRVIVASCTPRTHQPLFQETMREAGLNQYLFEMADIREQCSWVHQQEHEKATEKAKALVRGSVGKASLLEPLQFKKVGITKAALIVGGGMAGMTASLSLARQGFKVALIEKSSGLGGNLRHIHKSLEGYEWQPYLEQTIAQVTDHPDIDVYLNCEIDEVSGFVGNFTTRLAGPAKEEIKHGAIVVATGAGEYQPEGFLFAQNERVITQRTLEEKLENGFAPRSVVMIQCVGSRDKDRPYCSRVCCAEAVKNAIALKERSPLARITILYRDIRTYQFKEEYYRKAREMSVRFIHFPDERYPSVEAEGQGLAVRVFDTVLGEEIELAAECVALSAATVPDKAANRRLADLLKVSTNDDGFFMEAHVKLRPVDFANEGIFVCGLAHSPKSTEENITQALAAAGRAACILSRDSLEVGGAVSWVDPDKCATCLTCVRECVFKAPFVNAEGKAEIEAAKCQGCGNCAAACPGKAIQLRTFTDSQQRALFRSILREEPVAPELVNV